MPRPTPALAARCQSDTPTPPYHLRKPAARGTGFVPIASVAVKTGDYYQVLGVERTASADEIQRAYRKLARQHHPDVNKGAAAAEKFKQVAEAYEVLKDPVKRQKYDQFGMQWRDADAGGAGGGVGDWDEWIGRSAKARRPGRAPPGPAPGDFNDLFHDMFGTRGAPFSHEPQAEPAHHGELSVTLLESAKGGTSRVHVRDGRGERTIDVRIPVGVVDGDTIRLAGQGVGGSALRLLVKLAPDPRFKPDGRDLTTELPIAPWEAALGARVRVRTLDGEATVTVPPGTSSGAKLRLRGQGLPGRGSAEPGDLLVILRIVIPKNLTAEERSSYQRLAESSNFDPRSTYDDR